MTRRAKSVKRLIASSFVLSTRSDGAVYDWATDDVLGLILTTTFNEACDRVVEFVGPHLDWPVKTVPGGKSLRAHLINAESGDIIGVVSGWELNKLFKAADNVAWK